MNKLKEGDLITVVKDEYRQKGSAQLLLIQSPGLGDGNGIRELRGKEIYSIEHHDFHKDLSKLGVNVGHYTLSGMKIEQIAFPPDNPDIIRINGEYDIPDKPGLRKTSILDTFFFDYDEAKEIATQLNEVELEKLEELSTLVEKAKENMEDVVKNKRV